MANGGGGGFFQTGVGDAIQQAAQTILATVQQRNQLVLQQRQFEDQVKQQQKVFALQQNELDLQNEKFVLDQEVQTQRRAIEADKEARAKETAPLRLEELRSRTIRNLAQAEKAKRSGGGASVSLQTQLNSRATSLEFRNAVTRAAEGLGPALKTNKDAQDILNIILAEGPSKFIKNRMSAQRNMERITTDLTASSQFDPETLKGVQNSPIVLSQKAIVDTYDHFLSALGPDLARLSGGVAADQYRQQAANEIGIDGVILDVIDKNAQITDGAAATIFGGANQETITTTVSRALGGDPESLAAQMFAASPTGQVLPQVWDAAVVLMNEEGAEAGLSGADIQKQIDLLFTTLRK